MSFISFKMINMITIKGCQAHKKLCNKSKQTNKQTHEPEYKYELYILQRSGSQQQ